MGVGVRDGGGTGGVTGRPLILPLDPPTTYGAWAIALQETKPGIPNGDAVDDWLGAKGWGPGCRCCETVAPPPTPSLGVSGLVLWT